jgi:uncharacterized protein (PEP-CTERM system associated)
MPEFRHRAAWLAGTALLAPAAALAQVPLPGPGWAPPALVLPAGEPATGAPAAAAPEPGLAPYSGPPELGGPPRTGLILAPGFTAGLPAPPPGQPGRAWTVQPSLGLQFFATDNINQTATNKQSEFITGVTPGLLVTADTARLRGVLNYRPSLLLYAEDSSQSRVLQNFNGQALATIVPERFFLDLRGAGATQAVGGGFAPQSTPTLNRQGVLQTTSFQASPYFVQRFGDIATLQVGYGFQAVQQSLGGGATTAVTPNGLVYFSDTHYVANSGFATLRTGPNFGRLAMEARLVSTDYSGNGVYDGAYRRVAVAEARYAITRQLAVLAEGGYEMQRYSTLPRFELSEPIWAAGVRLNLSPESVVTLKYGHRDGVDSPTVNAVLALGGRTRLFANYSERLSSSAQRAADLLSATTVDALGNPVDSFTGAPILQPFADSFFGTQSGLQLVRQGSVTISQSWPRDTIFLNASWQRLTPVAAAPGQANFAQTGYTVNLAWAHALTPRTSVTAGLQYGWQERSGAGQGALSGSVYGGSVAIATQLTPGLSAFAQYGITSREDFSGSGGRAIQNTILVGLRQTF